MVDVTCSNNLQKIVLLTVCFFPPGMKIQHVFSEIKRAGHSSPASTARSIDNAWVKRKFKHGTAPFDILKNLLPNFYPQFHVDGIWLPNFLREHVKMYFKNVMHLTEDK